MKTGKYKIVLNSFGKQFINSYYPVKYFKKYVFKIIIKHSYMMVHLHTLLSYPKPLKNCCFLVAEGPNIRRFGECVDE